MAAIFTNEARVSQAIAPYADQVSIAALNGPENVVISGTGEVVGALVNAFEAKGIKSRPLTVSHAFHSPLVEPMLDEFARQVRFVVDDDRLVVRGDPFGRAFPLSSSQVRILPGVF